MSFSILNARTSDQIDQARVLMLAYVDSGLVDLSSQNIELEIAGLPGDYRPPTGELFIATDQMGEAMGCIAVHTLGQTGDAEIKRLFVQPDYRGRGIGTALLNAAIGAAKQMRCRRIVLDTMPTMTSAIAIYKSLGFEEIDPYWDNILPVVYFAKTLETV